MVVSTGKCVAATCQLYFCCLGHRSGCALRNARHRRLFHILHHLLSCLHSPRKYRSDRSKQPRLLFFREPQALSPTRTGKSGKHLLMSGKTHSMWNECPQPRNTFHRGLSFLHSSKSHFLWLKFKT